MRDPAAKLAAARHAAIEAGTPADQRFGMSSGCGDQMGKAGQIMLPVGIDLDNVRKSAHLGPAQAGDNRATLAPVDRQSDYLHAVGGGMEARYRRSCRLVAGVIDDDYVEPRAAQAGHHRAKCDEVVVARNYGTCLDLHGVPNWLRDSDPGLSRIGAIGQCGAKQLSLSQVRCQGPAA